ncbi:uncharacterized protein LOC143859280 [Tasmannia lanceolata]|uniref:uncharacterized protein LOC143859280 n=1 Tax=Tasmannia lanceolata TaxID=3420 RepID=UPI0040628C68
MRIRKQANKSSSSLFISPSSNLVPCTRVCELNRSPWDVSPLPPQPYSSLPKQSQDGEDESLVKENGSERESVGVVFGLKKTWEVKEEEVEEEEEDEKNNKEEKEGRICRMRGGKGWKCKREAKNGHSLCAHHLTQRRSYRYEPSRKFNDEVSPADRTARNGSDFYYYSGFGPCSRKKRKRGGKFEMDDEIVPLSSSNHDHGLDNKHHENDNDDNNRDENVIDDDGDYRKKKGRKPMKSRSLKSIL